MGTTRGVGRVLRIRSGIPTLALLALLSVVLFASPSSALTPAAASGHSPIAPLPTVSMSERGAAPSQVGKARADLPIQGQTTHITNPFAPPGSSLITSGCGGTAAADAACSAAEKSLSPAQPLGPAPSTWNLICGPCTIGGREGDAMAYDAKDGYVVLFGGVFDSDDLMTGGDTWTYSAGVWTNITSTACPTGCPATRFDVSMAWDGADGYVLLFGGVTTSYAYFDDTWSFVGGVWTELYPATSPGGRFYGAMTYDAADKYVLLFGGVDTADAVVGDTWEWSGGTWTEVSASGGPAARYTDGMAYDATDGYVVLFGGIESGGTYASDTWKYSAGTWTNLAPATHPVALGWIAYLLVFDTSIAKILLWGGIDAGGTSVATTWTFTGGTWTQLTPTASPTAAGAGSLSDYPPGNVAVQFSGYETSTDADSQDTWEFIGPLTATLSAAPNPSDVTIPVVFTFSATGGLPPLAYSIRFGDGGAGGSSPSSHAYTTPGTYVVWLWVNDSIGSTATTSLPVIINPLPSATLTAVHNPSDAGLSVAFTATGTGGTGALTYAWRFGEGGAASGAQNPVQTFPMAGTFTVRNWVNDTVGGSGMSSVSLLVNPDPSVTVVATPSPTDAGKPVSFVGTPAGGTGAVALAWEFGDGSPGTTGASVQHTYAARGNYTARTWANDTLGVSGSASTVVIVNPALSAPTIVPDPEVADVGTPVNLSASFWGGTAPFTYAWHFGDGLVSARANPTTSYAAVGNYAVDLWVNDSAGGAQFATLNIEVNPDPQVESFTASSVHGFPGQIDLGQDLSTTVVMTSGTGTAPFIYAYSGMPTGCAEQPAAISSCTPTTVGLYSLEVSVTDAAGSTAHAWLNGSVNQDPFIESFTATPANGTSPLTVAFVVVALGGTGPLTYNYSVGTSGCTALAGARSNCTISGAGTYDIHVTVTDLWGRQANGTVVLQVQNPPGILGVFGSALPWWLWLVILAVVVAAVCLILWSRRRKKQPMDEAYAGAGMAVAGGAVAGGEFAPSPAGVMAPAEGPMMTSDGYPVDGVAPGAPPAMTSDGYPMEPVAPGPPPGYAPPPDDYQAGMDATPPPQVAEVPRPPPTQWVAVPVTPAAQVEPAPPSTSGPTPQEADLASAPPPPPEVSPPPPPAAPAAAPEVVEARPTPKTCVLCGNPMGTDGRCGTCGWAPAH